jgi:hypothetical protein
MEPRRARQQAWVRSIWPDSQRLQRCRSRGLVLVTVTEVAVVPVATMSVGTQTAPIMAIALRSLSLPNPGWTVGFCGNRPVEIKKKGSAVSSFISSRTRSYWPYAVEGGIALLARRPEGRAICL